MIAALARTGALARDLSPFDAADHNLRQRVDRSVEDAANLDTNARRARGGG